MLLFLLLNLSRAVGPGICCSSCAEAWFPVQFWHPIAAQQELSPRDYGSERRIGNPSRRPFGNLSRGLRCDASEEGGTIRSGFLGFGLLFADG